MGSTIKHIWRSQRPAAHYKTRGPIVAGYSDGVSLWLRRGCRGRPAISRRLHWDWRAPVPHHQPSGGRCLSGPGWTSEVRKN